ncbi:universal stress protein [Streptomyces griseus]|uniref:universal stress protein n=1 Tax=Streptomyces TaxID=1883 RepID=UPI0001C1D490|nr:MULTISPECIES: universal stress protein [Streptomyces]MYR14697.1 universal stress protein [Streptomyces sp. SID724]MYR50323.1 universal stress protein [Streptomyces sp. SID4928]MYT80813.1 universal stress protein [Streptomyces sp. SID8364]NEB55824.1 universal stress protein [Streptomyces griseus]EGE42275.1 UspA domain-containing protein [Streptomyces sp. ACT-1]
MRQRIVVGVSGSPGSLAALHRATAEARERDADLCAVLAWQLPGGGLGGRATYGTAALREYREAAVEHLRTLLDGAFAVRGPGVALSGFAVRGEPGAVLVEAAESADGLLVVGAGTRGRWLRALRPSVARYCLEHAACPVLAVPPNPLEAELAAVLGDDWPLPPGP